MNDLNIAPSILVAGGFIIVILTLCIRAAFAEDKEAYNKRLIKYFVDELLEEIEVKPLHGDLPGEPMLTSVERITVRRARSGPNKGKFVREE